MDEIHSSVAIAASSDPHPAGPTPEPVTPVPAADDIAGEAEDLLRNPAVLDRLVDAIQASGVVGEEDNIRRVALVVVSRVTDHPLGAIIKSGPGLGKSNAVQSVIDHVDPVEVVEATRLTAQALSSGETDLSHKVLWLEEEAGAPTAWPSVRVLFSKGRLSSTTARGTREVRGPIAFLSTTIKDVTDLEMESRLLLLSVDSSPEQTRRIAEQKFLSAELGSAARADDGRRRAVWAKVFDMVGAAPVKCPGLTEFMAPRIGNQASWRRGSGKFVSLVRAHTLLHQRNRKMEGSDLVATQEDYEACWRLFQDQLAEVPAAQRDLADRLQSSFGGTAFTAKQAATAWGFDTDYARRSLNALVEMDLAAAVTKGRGRRGGTWRLVEEGCAVNDACRRSPVSKGATPQPTAWSQAAAPLMLASQAA